MSVSANIVNKNFKLSSFPSVQSGTYPYYFDDPVPISINILFTWQDGNSYTAVGGGILKGWTSALDFVYPHIRVCRQVNGGNGGFIIDIGSGIFDNWSIDWAHMVNGQITESGTTTSGLDATYYWGGQLSGEVSIMTCDLPVIYDDNIDTEIYAYSPLGNHLIGVPAWIDIPVTQDLDGEHILNVFDEEETPDGEEFRIEVQWTTSTWINDNQPIVTGQPYIQGVKGKITNCTTNPDGSTYVPFALYKIDGVDDGKLKYGIINNATFYDLEYTTDGVTWTPTDTFPFEFIYRKRERELGTFSYALSVWNTGVPRWNDPDDAQDYIDGNKPISDADNWDEISPNYPPQNLTGDPDDVTDMGNVYTRAFFSQQYICGVTALQEISNALFDTTAGGVWEDIKKGLEMYGDSPVDDIQGCMFFPLDLNQVFTSTQSQNYIYFGGYRFDLQNSSVNKIIYPNGVYDFGSFDIRPSFAYSYRDYAPYSRLFCYLAYIGWVELDIARYIGKTANIRYYIDTRTGGCLACIFANGVLTDYFNGQMGVSMPITATDFVGYANAQIQTLLTGASGVKGNAGTMFSNAQSMMNAGVSASAVAGAMLPVATAMVGAQGAKTLYGLTQNNINNFNKTMGSSTSMLNQYLPQYCMMMWEIQDGTETPNEKSLQGYPSNASNILSAFSGYLECDAVNLICGIATDNERAEIIQYLKSGVII